MQIGHYQSYQTDLKDIHVSFLTNYLTDMDIQKGQLLT